METPRLFAILPNADRSRWDHFVCPNCITNELQLDEDDAQLWEEGSPGWTGPVTCSKCGADIEVMIGEGND